MVRLSALGDVLMFVPLVRTLQHAFPEVALTWVISRPAYDLVEGMTGIEFIVIEKPHTIADYWRFKKQLADRYFDVLLAAQASFRANLLYACIRATRKIGYDPLRAKDGHKWFIDEHIEPGCDHTLEGFLKFAYPLGITTPRLQWDLPIPFEADAWVQARLPAGKGPLVVINPAASKPERSWLPERYIAVIHHLQTQWQARIILTGGPGAYDQQLGQNIAERCQIENWIGQTQPKQLLALIRCADLVICPDTGPSHMAAAVHTPVIALHAVTSAAVSGPYPFRHLSVDCYTLAVEKILKKTPTTIAWGTHAHGSETMALIAVDAVLARIASVLAD